MPGALGRSSLAKNVAGPTGVVDFPSQPRSHGRADRLVGRHEPRQALDSSNLEEAEPHGMTLQFRARTRSPWTQVVYGSIGGCCTALPTARRAYSPVPATGGGAFCCLSIRCCACRLPPIARRRSPQVVGMLIEFTGASVAGTLRADACDAAFSRWSLRVVDLLLPADM